MFLDNSYSVLTCEWALRFIGGTLKKIYGNLIIAMFDPLHLYIHPVEDLQPIAVTLGSNQAISPTLCVSSDCNENKDGANAPINVIFKADKSKQRPRYRVCCC